MQWVSGLREIAKFARSLPRVGETVKTQSQLPSMADAAASGGTDAAGVDRPD
jgi:hypothetical protein